MRGRYKILCLVAIVFVSDFYVPYFLVERGGGNEVEGNNVQLQIAIDKKGSF